jgi:hypothetical protein
MKKILLITLLILSSKGYAQVDSASVSSMINLAIIQQSQIADEQLQEIRNNYDQLQASLDNYQLHIDSLFDQDQG